MEKLKDRHPPRMMTSKDDYEHESVNSYINELFIKSIQKKHTIDEERGGRFRV
jgi:hypothetical protein|tara:strand:- start:2871 stop:3029 length:159 start_codon:yes stop_codon:yes gene_type:complete